MSDRARSATGTEWEVFLRPERGDALRHVGSVTASDATGAHEHAARLFGPDAADVWVCPATAVTRFAGETLDDRAEPATVAGEAGAAGRTPVVAETSPTDERAGDGGTGESGTEGR